MLRYFAEKEFEAEYCHSNGEIALKTISDVCDEPLHEHDFVEIVFVTDGKGTHVVNDEEYPVKRGDCLYINHGCTHAFRVEGRLEAYNLMIKVDYFHKLMTSGDNIFTVLALTSMAKVQHELDRTSPLVSFHGEERAEIAMFFRLLERELCTEKVGKRALIDSYINAILTSMLRKIFVGDAVDEEVDLIPERVLDYIKSHCDEKITLQSISEQCFYNPSYFSRLFKKIYNITLTEFILQQRLKKSCELLYESDLSVDQIAIKCGFGDKTAFYARFKAMCGCTPGAYRKRNKTPTKPSCE